jgi:Uma2 family endonuclease
MNPMAIAQRMTAQEYLAEPDESVRSELVEGEVIVHGPDLPHQLVLRELYDALRAWQRQAARHGEVMWPLDVQIDERNVFSPDLLWYAEGHAPMLGDARPYPVPDLAIEIRSPSTWRYDIGAKKAAYERNGLPELWLVDPTTNDGFVFRRSSVKAASFDVALELGPADTLTSPQLPGFAVALATIFPA